MANSALPIGIFNSNLINIQVFKSSGTYTPSTGVSRVLVRAWGGGGGGGTTNSGSIGGPGGGGAAYVEALFANTASQTITIGAAGTGGVANNGTNSTAGGDTSFGSFLVAKGGGRGESSGGNPGAGGDAAACTVPLGGFAISGTTGGHINTLGSIFSIGGSAFGGLHQAFPPNVVTVSGVANAGMGGQGGNNTQNGGNGSSGLLIVYEFSNGANSVDGTNKILQVLQGSLTNTASTTSATFVDTGLTVSITPMSNLSKIMVSATVACSSDNGYMVALRLVRDSTPLNPPSSPSNRVPATTSALGTAVTGNMWSASMSHLDSPSTTSTTVYKVQYAIVPTGGTAYINRGATDTDSGSFVRGASSIIVMEVADTAVIPPSGASAATQSDMETATSTTTYVSPGMQKYHPAHPKAWVKFNGTGTVAMEQQHGVTSVGDNGDGAYTINFATNFSSIEYGINCAACDTGGSKIVLPWGTRDGGGNFVYSAPLVGSVKIAVVSFVGVMTDASDVSLMAFGDQ